MKSFAKAFIGVVTAVVAVLAIARPASADPIVTNQNYFLRNLQYNQCMDLANSGTANGTPIGKYTCAAGIGRAWNFEFIGNKCADGQPLNCRTTYRIHTAVASNKCIDINDENIDTGETIHIWDCRGNASQLWYLVGNSDGSYKFASYKAFFENSSNQFAIDAGQPYSLRIWPMNDQSKAQYFFAGRPVGP